MGFIRLPDHCAFYSEKSPERNLANQFWHRLSFKAIYIGHITSCVLAMGSCLFGNNTIKYVWNIGIHYITTAPSNYCQTLTFVILHMYT